MCKIYRFYIQRFQMKCFYIQSCTYFEKNTDFLKKHGIFEKIRNF